MRAPRTAAVLALALIHALSAAPRARAEQRVSAADSALYVLPDVLVEAPRLGTRAFPFPRSVLDPARGGPAPGRDLADLLSGSPSAQVRKSGGPGARSLLSLRASPPEGVLFLLDGERLNGADGGAVDLSQIALAGIARVDVVRGGASLLYGSEALGGVVEMVRTPSDARPETRVAFEAGSLGTLSGSATLARPFPRGWLRITAQSLRSDGEFEYEDRATGSEATRLNAGGESGGVAALAESRVGAGVVRFALRASRADRGSPGLVDFPTPEARQRDERGAAQVRFVARSAEVSAALSRVERSYVDPAGALGPIDARHRSHRASLRATASARRGAADLTGGLEGRYDDLESTTDGSPVRRTGALFAIAAAAGPAGLRASGGLRLDAISAFHPAVTERVGLSWERGPARVRASVGTSFRAPGFDDLFWPSTGMAVGNPDLRPEQGVDRDVGLDLRVARAGARASVDLFEQDIEDVILWTPGPSGIWTPSNVGRAEIRGLEVSLAWNEAEARGLPRIEASGSLLEARDRTGRPNTDGRFLPGRARGLAALRVEKGIGRRFRVETAWRAVDDVPRTAANTKWIPGYVVGSVGARLALGSALVARADVENVGDVAYQDFHEFPLPGRLFLVSVEWRREAEAARRGGDTPKPSGGME
jgi:vitamin B12 transporter